jgi:hypothetical protein
MNLQKQATHPQQNYRTIPLTQGQVAIVDVGDFDWLNQYKWCAHWNPLGRSFYAMRSEHRGESRVAIYMHRQILGLEPGDSRTGDHIEVGDTLNNRRINLRIATHSENCRNRKTRQDNISGYKGVCFHRLTGKWQANVMIEGKWKSLGRFITAEAANVARISAAKEHYGEFVNRN